jgi:hypothetical protein
LVSLPEGIFNIVKELKGKLGESNSEVVRDIVIAYLNEQGYLAKGKTIVSKQSKRDKTRDLAEELDVFDTMLSALVELLEEKGILTQKEWERRIKRKSLRAKGMTSYRDIRFSE